MSDRRTVRNAMMRSWQGTVRPTGYWRLSGGVAAIGVTPTPSNATIASTGLVRPAAPISIGTSTNRSMGLCQRVGTFTTGTGTRSTMTRATLLRCRVGRTHTTTTPSVKPGSIYAASAGTSSGPASGPTTFVGARPLARNAGAGALVLHTSNQSGRTTTLASARSVGLNTWRTNPGLDSARQCVGARTAVESGS